jgi:6,7-dimethyl-8-ribityllumazine synthase
MATADLSKYDPDNVPSGSGMRIGIVVSEWNREITNGLLNGASSTLGELDVAEDDITVMMVPGSFELAAGAQILLESGHVDGVICLGSVIQGETRHFDFVCQSTADGIMRVGLDYKKPVIFGVLTDNTLEQAEARSGGKHGNKGVECAVACVKMIALNT